MVYSGCGRGRASQELEALGITGCVGVDVGATFLDRSSKIMVVPDEGVEIKEG